MNKFNLSGFFTKGLIIISGLSVLTLALIGSFYLVMATIVIALSTALFSAVRSKPQPVRVRTARQPLDAEYRVIRRK